MIQFTKRTPCFSFLALDAFPSRLNVQTEILKVFDILNIFSIVLKTRVRNITSNKFGLCNVNAWTNFLGRQAEQVLLTLGFFLGFFQFHNVIGKVKVTDVLRSMDVTVIIEGP